MPVVQQKRLTTNGLIRETVSLTLQALEDVDFDVVYVNDPTHQTYKGVRCIQPAHHFYLKCTSQPKNWAFTLYKEFDSCYSPDKFAQTICKSIGGFWYPNCGHPYTSEWWTPEYLSGAIIMSLRVLAGDISKTQAEKQMAIIREQTREGLSC